MWGPYHTSPTHVYTCTGSSTYIHGMCRRERERRREKEEEREVEGRQENEGEGRKRREGKEEKREREEDREKEEKRMRGGREGGADQVSVQRFILLL